MIRDNRSIYFTSFCLARIERIINRDGLWNKKPYCLILKFRNKRRFHRAQMNSFAKIAQYDFFYQKVSDENVAANVTLNATVTLIVADAMRCIIMILRQVKYQLFWHSDRLYCDLKIYWSSLKLVSDFSKIDRLIIKSQTDLDTHN